MFTSDQPFLRFPSVRQAPRGKDGKYADGRETTEKTGMELSAEEEQQLLNSPGEAAVMDHVYFWVSSSSAFTRLSLLVSSPSRCCFLSCPPVLHPT